MEFPQSADLSLRLMRPIVRYVMDHYGRAELERIAVLSGLTIGDFDGTTRWAALEQIETLLANVRQLMPDDRTFLRACGYELDEPRGPVRLAIGALTPTAAYEIGAKMMRTFSSISQFHVELIQRGEVRIRYTTTRSESRLMCFTRLAQIGRASCRERGENVCVRVCINVT